MVREHSNDFGYGSGPTQAYGSHSSAAFPQARPVRHEGDLRRDKSMAASVGGYEMDDISAGSVGMPVPNPSAPSSRSHSGSATPLPAALQAGSVSGRGGHMGRERRAYGPLDR